MLMIQTLIYSKFHFLKFIPILHLQLYEDYTLILIKRRIYILHLVSGQVMRSQARRRANTTCCLDMVSKCSNVNNTEEMRYDLFWNPIVFEQGSFQNTSLACSFGGCNARSYTWGASRTPRCMTLNR